MGIDDNLHERSKEAFLCYASSCSSIFFFASNECILMQSFGLPFFFSVLVHEP
jgi:hypothetical protein